MKDEPIETHLIEDLLIKYNDSKLFINNKQAKLNQISVFNSNKIKGIVKAEIKRNI